ncbi:MAG: M56 family metallopeptidase, partial [Ralstonia sp.]
METLLAIGISNALAAAALGLVAAGVARLVRRPALAHALWVVVLLKLLTPPLVRVPVGGLPTDWNVPGTERREPPSDRFEAGGTQPPPFPGAVAPPADRVLQTERGAEAAPGGTEHATRAARSANDQSAATESKRSEAGGRATPAPAPRWVAIVFWVWVAASAGAAGLALARIGRFARLLRRGEPASADLTEPVASLAARLGLRRSPAVWLVPGAFGPAVWAVGRARLLFPAALAGRLSPAAREALLAHELAHLKRRDHWVRWMELAARIAYWWHPLVW